MEQTPNPNNDITLTPIDGAGDPLKRNPDPDPDLAAVLAWVAANDATFSIGNIGGTLVVQARCNNISSEYKINEPYSGPQLGAAVWASLFAVKHGTEYHKRFGFFPPRPTPPPQSGESPSGIDGGERQSANSEGAIGGSEAREAFIPDAESAAPDITSQNLQ
jgi:hypothetical protein